jgi:demethylmenaquinone methyltransferase / 2-methoxy-6-polyprenyl-1,4-benzoquinol methylase
MPDTSRFTRSLFSPLPARYDQLAEILSFAQNGRWRLAAVAAIAKGVNGDEPLILDVASGTAGVAIELARRTGGTVVGVDLTEPMLRRGMANVAASGVTGRIRLVAGQAERLPFGDATFDALAFSYLLRYVADPQATLTELARVVRPGGVMASLEFCVPAGPVRHPAWLLYTRLLLPVEGLAAGGPAWWRVGRFLGPSISRHYRRYPVEWTVRAWERAGFTGVSTRRMSLGGGLIMWGTRAHG